MAATAVCNQTAIEQDEVWEFLPQKGYLHEPIEITISLGEQSDVVKINFEENNVKENYKII